MYNLIMRKENVKKIKSELEHKIDEINTQYKQFLYKDIELLSYYDHILHKYNTYKSDDELFQILLDLNKVYVILKNNS